jgi:hypothetical protein
LVVASPWHSEKQRLAAEQAVPAGVATSGLQRQDSHDPDDWVLERRACACFSILVTKSDGHGVASALDATCRRKATEKQVNQTLLDLHVFERINTGIIRGPLGPDALLLMDNIVFCHFASLKPRLEKQ